MSSLNLNVVVFMITYSARDFKLPSVVPSNQEEPTVEMAAAIERSPSGLVSLYDQLWSKLLKKIIQYLLKEAIEEYNQAIKDEWYLFWPSARRKALDENQKKLRDFLKEVESPSCSIPAALRHDALAILQSSKFVFLPNHGSGLDLLQKFRTEGNSLNPYGMCSSSIDRLKDLDFPWAKPLAVATEKAAEALYATAIKACEKSLEFEPVRNQFRDSIPSYLNLDRHRKKKFENSYLQVTYLKWKPIDSSAKLKTHRGAATSKTNSALLPLAQSTIKKEDFYNAILDYLGQTRSFQQELNQEDTALLIKKLAKGRGFKFWKPSQKDTLLELLQAAEQPNLSLQDWKDIERKLNRLETSSLRKRGEHSEIPQRDNLDLRACFNHKRYGKINEIFNTNTENMKNSLEKISHQAETSSYISQFRTCYSNETKDLGENASLMEMMTVVNTAEESRQAKAGYTIPKNSDEMSRQLYFILLKHYPHYVKIEPNKSSSFTIDISAAKINFTDENDIKLFQLLGEGPSNDFTFSVLLLTKILSFIKGSHPIQYEAIRTWFIDGTLLTKKEIKFSDIPFQDDRTLDLSSISRRYLPRMMKIPTDLQITPIINQLNLMLPAISRETASSDVSSEKSRIDLKNIERLAGYMLRILNKADDKKPKILEQVNQILAQFSHVNEKSQLSQQQVDIYVLCKCYVMNKKGTSTRVTSKKEMSLVVEYCEQIINRIIEQKDISSIQKSDEFQQLLCRKGDSFSGARLLKYIDVLLKLEESENARTPLAQTSGDTNFPPSVALPASNTTDASVGRSSLVFYRSSSSLFTKTEELEYCCRL